MSTERDQSREVVEERKPPCVAVNGEGITLFGWRFSWLVIAIVVLLVYLLVNREMVSNWFNESTSGSSAPELTAYSAPPVGISSNIGTRLNPPINPTGEVARLLGHNRL